MSGGKSSSSTSQSTSTQQRDKRIGATDNAVVLTAEGGNVTFNELDGGAISAARDIAIEALKGIVGGASDAVQAVNANAEKAYAFADAARVQENEKNYKSTIQWVAIVLVVGLAAWGYVNAKR